MTRFGKDSLETNPKPLKFLEVQLVLPCFRAAPSPPYYRRKMAALIGLAALLLLEAAAAQVPVTGQTRVGQLPNDAMAYFAGWLNPCVQQTATDGKVCVLYFLEPRTSLKFEGACFSRWLPYRYARDSARADQTTQLI